MYGKSILLLIVIRKRSSKWRCWHSPLVKSGKSLSAMWESCRSTRDLRMQNSIGKLLNVINFVLFGNEKAKIRIWLSESFELRCNRGNIELILQFSTTIFERFIVEEDDVWLGELFTRLLWDTDIDVFVQWGVYQSYIVVTNDLYEFFSCPA